MSKNKITITGDLASGKSAVARQLCKILSLEYLSTGQIHRNIAAEMDMNALELNLHAEKNAEIDRRIDSVLINLNDDPAGYVVDSRLAWHFVKGSLKLYLGVNNVIAARRVMADKTRHNEPDYANIESALKKLRARKHSENTRFLEKYGADCADLSNFDVIINTSVPSIKEVTEQVLKIYQSWAKGDTFHKHWVSPKMLFPTQEIALSKDTICDIDISDEKPVEVIRHKDFFFIPEKHEVVSAYLLNDLSFIPIKILESSTNFEDFTLSDTWEKFHDFTFYDYPDLVKQ